MAQIEKWLKEEHILGCSYSGGGGGGGVENSFRSKKLSKKVPQRGLGVAQLEKIRLEEQQKKEAANQPKPSENSSLREGGIRYILLRKRFRRQRYPPPTSPESDFPDVEDKAEPQCPPGLRQYETMVVLRPDMSEDERLAFTQKYEELLVGGGAMYVEVLNRGVIPLAYGIRKKNKAGESNTYLDGIYLLFTYFTKPESMSILGETLLADDNVIRSSSFKIRKRKLF
ncbi:hypothetical protein DH2020_033459 [Rehmannia glutinosa]|uniref:30S ribosomal protein S6 alpha, chloroplastic n=1 Tax=Rehmannia glutinosa TaxID=99300 RepID=A0ABR0VEM9_REHGL